MSIGFFEVDAGVDGAYFGEAEFDGAGFDVDVVFVVLAVVVNGGSFEFDEFEFDEFEFDEFEFDEFEFDEFEFDEFEFDEFEFDDMDKYWSDFWYPESDDILIFDPECRVAVLVEHFGRASGIQLDDEVPSPAA